MDSGAPNLSVILSGIKESLACLTIGAVLGTSIYGITVLQTYVYYRQYPKDRTYLKTLVGILFLLDTATTAMIASGIYQYVVEDFGTPLDKFLSIIPVLSSENAITVVIATLTQCFFAQRLWYLSHNKVLVVVIMLLAICACGPGLGITAYLVMHPGVLSLATLDIRLLAGVGNGLSASCDILIAIGLCYYLQSGRSEFARTNSIVDRLMMYAIQRGVLTAICQTCHAITAIVFRGRFIFAPFAFMQGKLYCNTVLAMLNVRHSLKEGGNSESLMVPGSHLLTAIRHRDPQRYNSSLNPHLTSNTISTIEIGITSTQEQSSSFTLETSAIDSKA